MAIVSKNQPITEGLQMLMGAINGDPEARAKQQAQDDAFMLEQDRTDAYLRNIDAGIADQNAKLALQEKLDAAQIGNYGASSTQSLAAAAKSNAERDTLVTQLKAMNDIAPKMEGLFSPREVPAVNAPVNPAAAGPVQVPASTRPPSQQELYSGLGDALAPLIVARGGDPSGLGDFLLSTQALGANAGIIPPNEQEAKLRNALVGSGKMPDLNTALTTGRQNEVINLNATNDQALEKIKPATTSNMEATMWTDMLASGQATPEQFLNRDAKKSNISVGADGQISITEDSGGGFGTVANNTLDKAVIDADKNLTNIARMKETFSPDFATIPGKASNEVTNLMDKLQVGAITPEEQQKLQDYSVFAQATMTSLNDYIRAMTGAALSPGEVQRALAVMPTIGTGGVTGIFQGDGPTAFTAKLQGIENLIRATQQRAIVLKRDGINALDDSLTSPGSPYALENFMGGRQPSAPAVQGLGSELQQPAAPVQIRGDDDYNQLPSGAQFIAPDGTTRTKP